MMAAAVSAGLMSADDTRAAVIYQTNSPFGGAFGLIGFDVAAEQSVALRFTPGHAFLLDRVGVWFMNNDFSGKTHPSVTLTLRTDNVAGGSIPSDVIIEQWQFNVSAVGWDPVLEQVNAALHPVLQAGVNYWVVAQSSAPGGNDGVWNWAANDSGWMSICNGIPCEWTPANHGAVAAGTIEGRRVGDTNADGDVDVDDLLSVISHWGSCPAPCPSDVAPVGVPNGVIDVNDLLTVITNWG